MESIIGAYLALVVVIGSVAGLFIWSKYSTLYLKENIDEASSRFHYLLYPPILTLSYSNNESLLLTIQPRIPVYIREVIVRDLNGELLYYEYLDVFINSSYTLELPVTDKPIHILLVSRENVVYYYNPRDDPNLLTAPDHIRNKSYVDYDLIEYLSNNHNSSNSGISLLTNYGYKLHAGKISSSLYNQPGFREFLFLIAPVDCNRVMYPTNTYDLPCNCNLSNRHYWVTYGLYGRSSTSPYYTLTSPYYFVQNGSLLIIGLHLTSSPYNYNYFQVYRFLKYTSTAPAQLNIIIKIRGYYTDLRGNLQPLQLDFIPVVYFYDVDVSPYNPVSLITGYWSNNVFKLWLTRKTLEESPISINSVDYWNKTYSIVVNPLEAGLHSITILVGLEIVNTSNRGGFIEVEIQIET